jgi:ribosomal protein S18 acetylase RimI-like enzyme
MTVRQFSSSDSALFSRLRDRARRQRSDAQRPLKLQTAKPEDVTVLVAETGDSLHGYVCLRSFEGQLQRGLLSDLWVDPDHRGQGVGEALIRGAMQWADQAGWQRLDLWVREDNPPARRLYRKLGFRETGRMKHCDMDAPQQHLHLALRLPSLAALPF